MTRKKNEEALRREEEERLAWKVSSLRREEREYANQSRKSKENDAFEEIRAEIERQGQNQGQSKAGRTVLAPAVLADEV